MTGVKRSLLGRDATGNPSFVAQLLGGVPPKLSTVEAVRASMQSHASSAEWREIRACAGAVPAILTDTRCRRRRRLPGAKIATPD